MKFSLILIATLLGCSSCEKVRSLIGKGEEKPPAAAVVAVAAKPHTGAAVSEISASDFESFRQQSGKVIIVDFYADWCGPCKQLGPILDQVASSHQGLVLVGKVNVDKSPELAASEKVKSIPDVRIFRDGKEIDRFVGLPPEAEVRRRIESHLKGIVPAAPESAEAEKPKIEEEKPKIVEVEKPKVVEAGKPKDVAAKPNAEVEKPKVAEPLTRPMPKDWMPEGMKRR